MKRIVWLGPMGGDEVSARAMEIAQFFLDPACKENGFDFRFPRTLDAENWLTALLDEIRGATGIICDISGARCNVYFELGFAQALGIPTLLICGAGSEIHVDLKNIQHHQYRTILDIRDVVHQWMAQLSAAAVEIRSVTTTLPHPFTIMEGDGQHEYVYNRRLQKRPFRLDESDTELTLASITSSQPELGETLARIHALQTEIAKRTFRPFFNGDLLGYMDHRPIRDASGALFGAQIAVRRTNYHTFAATHYPIEAIGQARELSLLSDDAANAFIAQVSSQMQSPSWPYARPLTAMIFAISELDGARRIHFQRRNTSRNFHASFSKQATAGGMIHPNRILAPHSPTETIPELAFIQELCEETGIHVEAERVRILALVRELRSEECAFVGYITIDQSDFDEKRIAIDAFESEAFESVALQPREVAAYLRSGADGGRDLTPLTLASLALVLTREFGPRTMQEIFADAQTSRHAQQ